MSFEYLCYPSSFINLLTIHSKPHVTRTPYFFILDRLVPRGDSPPSVTPHLVIPLVAITNWPR